MKVFFYECVIDFVMVVVCVVSLMDVMFVVGGINFLDLMKYQIYMFVYLIDVNGLGLDQIEVMLQGGLCIGVFVCNIVLVVDLWIMCDYLVLMWVFVVGVLGQLCNKVIMVGNLL